MKNNKKEHSKRKKSGAGSAANINAIISSPVDAARSHRHTDGWSNQGTNISYEGATAPGGGGSVGTGYSSGQNATGARITTSDEYEHAHTRKEKNNEDEIVARPEDQKDKSDEDTIGIP